MIAGGEWEEWQQRPLQSLRLEGSQALRPPQSLAVSGLKPQNREQRSVTQMCSLLPPGILGYMDGPHARLRGSEMGQRLRMKEEGGVKRGVGESTCSQSG